MGASESGMSRLSSSASRVKNAAGARILYTKVCLPLILELEESLHPNPIRSSALSDKGWLVSTLTWLTKVPWPEPSSRRLQRAVFQSSGDPCLYEKCEIDGAPFRQIAVGLNNERCRQKKKGKRLRIKSFSFKSFEIAKSLSGNSIL